MDPDTHKEIVEIKKEVRELRQAQDAEIQHNREKYIKLLEEAVNGDPKTARVLLFVDGIKSVMEIEKLTGISHATCWRKFDRLLGKEVLFKLEETKKGSPVYQQSRWFKKLRLEDYVRNKYLKDEQNVITEPNTNQNQAV